MAVSIDKYELIAFGYIRQCQPLLPSEPYYYIPNPVTVIISSYIAMAEKWDNELCGNGIDIEGEFETMCVKKDAGGYRSIFGSVVINSGCHEWEFKIHNTNNFSYALIMGITKEGHWESLLNSYITANSAGYGWSASSNGKLLTSGAEGKSYGSPVKRGDKVGMCFNMDKGSLQYTVNGVECGEPEWDKPIDTDVSYRMGLTFYGPHNVEILSYRQIVNQ
eukprot:315807_1